MPFLREEYGTGDFGLSNEKEGSPAKVLIRLGWCPADSDVSYLQQPLTTLPALSPQAGIFIPVPLKGQSLGHLGVEGGANRAGMLRQGWNQDFDSQPFP